MLFILKKNLIPFLLTSVIIYGIGVLIYKIPPYELIVYSKNILRDKLFQDLKNSSWKNAKKYIKIASTIDDLPNIRSVDEGYSFYIAGHTYGKPGVKSNGLYDPFTEKFHLINEY